MIKYILPLLLISSPVIADTAYICDHAVIDNKKVLSDGVQDSYLVISKNYLGYSVGNNPIKEIRKIELDHEEGIFTDSSAFFSKEYKTLTEMKDGKSLVLTNCNDVKL